jgi:holo-[acyl-carrier protein] synthase
MSTCLVQVTNAEGNDSLAAPRVGIDVVEVAVLERQLSGVLGEEFKRRVFTVSEIEDCRGDAAKFATRWAVKEAVSKAIGTGFRVGLRPNMIEVIKASGGSIQAAPSAGCRWPLEADTWSWAVSAAHESGIAVAVALSYQANQFTR